MSAAMLLLVLALVLGSVWYLRGRTDTRRCVAALPAELAAAPVPRRPGHMVNPCQDCCTAARRIASDWYPESRAPQLPLESCDHPQSCKCGWMRVLDRRSTLRRVDNDRRIGRTTASEPPQ